MYSRTADSPASIIAMRHSLNMTQEEFAHAIGVTVSTVNRWENGHVEPSRLARKAIELLVHRLTPTPQEFEQAGH